MLERTEQCRKMPLMRYFIFVGAALLALLFGVDAYLPKQPNVEIAGTTAGAEVAGVSAIRIQSDRKWPARLDFDTSLSNVRTAPVRTAEAAAPAPVANAAAPVRMRDAFAQLQTPVPSTPALQTPAPKKPGPKLAPKRRAVARSRTVPPTILVAQQPRMGFFPNSIW
jgi:hypothetical protein